MRAFAFPGGPRAGRATAILGLILALSAAGLGVRGARALASDGEPVRLRYDFARLAGKVAIYTIESEQRVFQSLDVRDAAGERGAGEVRVWQRLTLEQRFARGEDGGGVVTLTQRRIEARITSSETDEAWDSQSGLPPSPRFRAIAAELGKPVVLQVSARGEVLAARLASGAASPPSAHAGAFLVLPERPLALGEGWSQRSAQPFPPFGELHFRFYYRLAERTPAVEERLGRRRFEATVGIRYEPDPDGPQAHVELTRRSGGGHVVQDERGLLLEEVFDTEQEVTIKSARGQQKNRQRTHTVQLLRELRED